MEAPSQPLEDSPLDTETIADADLLIDAPRKASRRGYDRAEVDSFVEATRTRLETMAARLGRQQSELERLQSENRAFSRTIDIAISAADEVMSEATATAASTVGQAQARAAEIVDSAERRAAKLVADAEVEAHELVEVARADARDAVQDQRVSIDAELEMASALLRRAADEREALDALQADLTAILREASEYMRDVATDPAAAGRRLVDERALAELPPPPEPIADVTEAAMEAVSEEAHRPKAADFEPLATLDQDEADRFDQHTEFFSAEIEDDPSRKWILG